MILEVSVPSSHVQYEHSQKSEDDFSSLTNGSPSSYDRLIFEDNQ